MPLRFQFNSPFSQLLVPVAVIISVEAMAHYEALEDAELGRMAAEAYAEHLANPRQTISHEALWAEIEAGLEKA